MIVVVASELHFSLQQIEKLTLTQIKYFNQALQRKKIGELEMLVSSNRVGIMGDNDAYQGFLNKITEMKEQLEPSFVQQEQSTSFSEDFDWKKDEQVGLVASNVPREYFEKYFSNRKQVEKEYL